MPEILTESFCERCGTRYTFESAAPRAKPLRGLKVLGRGLKNFVLSDDASIDEAMAAARSEAERDVTTQQLDAFHSTFNFCMSCRQYTCANCWNDAEGQCLTCSPNLGRDILPAPFPTLEPAMMQGISLDSPEAIELEAPPAWPVMDGQPELDSEPLEEIDLSARLQSLDFGAATVEAAPVEPVPPVEAESLVSEPAVVEAADPVVEPVGAQPDELYHEPTAEIAATEAPVDEPMLAQADEQVLEQVPVEPSEEPTPEPVLAEAVEPVLAEAVEPVLEPEAATGTASREPITADPEPASAVESPVIEPVAEPVAAEAEPVPADPIEAEVEAEAVPTVIEAEPAAAAAPVAGLPTDRGLDEAIAAYEREHPADAEPVAVEPVPAAEPVRAAEPGSTAEPALVQPAVPEPEPGPTLEPSAAEPVPAPADDRIEQPVWLPVAPDTEPDTQAPAPPAPSVDPGIAAAASAAQDMRPAGDPQWPNQPSWPSQPQWPSAPRQTPRPSTILGRPTVPTEGIEGLWAASNQEVLGAPLAGNRQPLGQAPTPAAAQPCINCGLSLSATARFCRRCGTPQSAS